MVTPFQTPRPHPGCELHLWGVHRAHPEPYGNSDSGFSTRGWEGGGGSAGPSSGHSSGAHVCPRKRQATGHRDWMVKVTQSCSTLRDPTDCSPPGSSIHGILQARILEWVALPYSRGSSPPRDRTLVSCIGKCILYHRSSILPQIYIRPKLRMCPSWKWSLCRSSEGKD